ncbi:hypothetical protein SAMN05421813_10979 [Daejeonella rubra]|uniref:Uncharacterized protein n=1 Tax=Daejeonella rubra TaxID=990371 RepID=A0A1G9S5P3_9SPHI|nr:hypothetical protein SAMN05421813_10979 [Daejeonella rubra]
MNELEIIKAIEKLENGELEIAELLEILDSIQILIG